MSTPAGGGTAGADPAAAARAAVDAAAYMIVATAGADGIPWASPVWFATADRRTFYWVSDPGARHSRNIAARPQVALVLFDSHAPIGTGGGVYVAATAEQLAGDAAATGVRVLSQASQAQGGEPFALADVTGAARLRIYAAVAAEAWLGGRDDRRIAVGL
jgi:Pyridoxamine 5'-phosphate oxidase